MIEILGQEVRIEFDYVGRGGRAFAALVMTEQEAAEVSCTFIEEVADGVLSQLEECESAAVLAIIKAVCCGPCDDMGFNRVYNLGCHMDDSVLKELERLDEDC